MMRRVRPTARCQRHLIVTLSILCSSWMLGGCAEVPAPAPQITAAPAPAPTGTIDSYIHEASQKFNVPERWIRAVMQQESGGRPLFHGQPIVSPKGAMGLMQVMPSTWADLSAAYGLGKDPFDLHDNIMAGTAYIREMYDQYGNPGFLAAYNAGPGRYEVTLKTHRPLPDETKHYMAVISPQIAGIDPVGASPTPRMTMVASLRVGDGPAHSAVDGDPDAKPAAMVLAALSTPTPVPSNPPKGPDVKEPNEVAESMSAVPAAKPALDPAPAPVATAVSSPNPPLNPTPAPPPTGPLAKPAPMLQLASLEAGDSHPVSVASHPSASVTSATSAPTSHGDHHGDAHGDSVRNSAHNDGGHSGDVHGGDAAHNGSAHASAAHNGDRDDTVINDHHLPNGLVYADHRANLPPGWYVPVAYTH